MFRAYLPNSKRKGQALILSYMVISVFLVLSSALLSKAISEKNFSLRNKLNTEIFFLAEGGTENAISAFTKAIANYQIPADVQSFNVSTTFNTFGGTTVNSTVTRLENNDRLILEGTTNVMVRNYDVVTTATHPQNNGITITLHQIIARRLIPTFQHAVFYNGDLEMLPGANMTLSGRIHSNKDIYADSEVTLTVDSFYFHSAGNIYNKRKDSSINPPGDANIRINQPGAPKYAKMNGLDSNSPDWTTEAINRWKGTVQSAVHGITQLSTPSVGSIQPTGYYASNANVIIQNGVIAKGGVVLTEGVNYPAGTITTTTALYNNREGKTIKTTNIDLKKLAGYAPSDPPGKPSFPNNLPSNGLMYATRNDSGASYEPGIKLFNAGEIYQNIGLTLVSNDPVYIQGNYNTTNEKPASVICDSLNLLSNNWKDSNSSSGLSSRTATATTFNSAFIAGIEDTTTGQYNGGLENYPRLHENWSNIQLNIKGSFVALWNSAIGTGAWKYGSPQYTAPLRNWNYDTMFNNSATLPPFTPWAVEAQRVAWWKE